MTTSKITAGTLKTTSENQSYPRVIRYMYNQGARSSLSQHEPSGILIQFQVQLVFYSTFEPKAMGVQRLYEPSPTPILYVGHWASSPMCWAACP